MAAMLPMIDMRPVYDEFQEGFTMRMRVWSTALLFGLGVGAAIAQAPAQNQPQPMPMGGMDMGHGMGMDHGMKMDKPVVPAGPLKITFGDKSAEWTAATLAALPHKTVTVFNEHAKVNQSYSGVPLMELLTRLGVSDTPHGKFLRFYLVAEGSDGYKTVYSLAEVNPIAHDGTVIVADALDGKALAGDGPLKLIATGDKHPARWVRNLVAVRVLAVE
jgi:hypothetical protein